MAVFSLLYASISTLPGLEPEAAIEELVAGARKRNGELDVTGCLIFAGGRFAQVLEGEYATVTGLMDRIARDPRHREVTILEQEERRARRFANWELDYAGPSFFVQRTISRPVAEAMRGSRRGIDSLLEIMTTFRAEQIAAPHLPAQ
ncbi:MAG TPA: BLUF domain-containing protein [Allosphingosinicella sp.]